MNPGKIGLLTALGAATLVAVPSTFGDSPVVDSSQLACYDTLDEMVCPPPGAPFYGQDAEYEGYPPAYVAGEDGAVVFDRRTGLTWQKSPDLDGDETIDVNDKLTWAEALEHATTLNEAVFAGHDDWRLPTIKELYSLMSFEGVDPSGYSGTDPSGLTPFIDTEYFDFAYGDTDAGERLIDAQFWSSTPYVGLTMQGDATAFGVNFADGRIKGYPTEPVGPPGNQHSFRAYVRYVRGNPDYGVNRYVDTGGGTITDLATGLVWQQADSGVPLDWQQGLAYCESLTIGSCDDWRLPNVKELQSIVDYTRSPDTTGSAAIDPIFDATSIVDEGGQTNYPYYWSSTTHANWTLHPGHWGAYVCFGEALGWIWSPLDGDYVLLDVHGAGSQRSDPKAGDPADYPFGNGPQGDVVRIFNHVRCVRGQPIRACEIRLGASSPTTVALYPDCPAPAFSLVTGTLAELRTDGSFARSSCLGLFVGSASVGQDDPAPGEGYYYLARAREPAACAPEGYGQARGLIPDPREELGVLDPCP